jgi:solute carrier family 13 (sodium-dependent dicarboxylate transporter), member 2/3/5
MRGPFALAAALACGLVVLAIPAPAGLPPAGQRTAAIFAFALVLWATEAIPIAVTALLTVILQPILRIQTPGAAFQSFMSPVFFFVLASFFLAAALVDTGLQRRFALWLLARAGTRPASLLLALMAGTALVSSVLSDVPTCAIFMTAALGVFANAGIRPGSNVGKAIMIGIPIASLTGGVATPAGSSINVLGMQFIEQYGHQRVAFLSWTAIGVPLVLVLIPIAWRVLLWCFPPEVGSVGSADEARVALNRLERLSGAEWRILLLFIALIVLWVLSTWVPALDLVLVAMAGAVALFLPGLRLLTWEKAQRSVGWDALLMIGGVTSLGAASVASGLAKWLVGLVVGRLTELSPAAAIAAVSALTVLAHLAIPIAPVINSVLIPPLAMSTAGSHPAMLALPVAFTASCAYLLPLDAVSLLTYSTGYYSMTDMLKPGLVISVFWVIALTVLMVLLGPPLGFF